MGFVMRIHLFILVVSVALHPLIAQKKCEKEFMKTRFKYDAYTDTNVVLIWYPANVGTHTSLRLCSTETGLTLQRHCGYNRLNNSAVWEEINANLKLINCSDISQFCEEETFEHKYITKTHKIQPFVSKWKTTHVGEVGELQDLCLQKSGLPLTRRCVYNPVNNVAQWELLTPKIHNMYCLKEIPKEVITYDLNGLYKEAKKTDDEDKVEAKEIVQQMNELLTTSQNVRIPHDIKISGEILKIITEEHKGPELLTEVLNATSAIMASKRATILSSISVNAPSTILKTIDTYFLKVAHEMVPTNYCSNITDGIVYKTSQLASVFYINPVCSNISGLAIYNKKLYKDQQQQQLLRYDGHTGQHYRFLYLNDSLEEILNEPELHMATYFPLALWDSLKSKTKSINDRTVLTFLIFQNDNIFANRTVMNMKPTQSILEISIANYTGELPADIPFVFNYHISDNKSIHQPECGYWNYSTWILTGIQTKYKYISDRHFLICHSSHLTHFAALFSHFSMDSQQSESESFILNIPHNVILDNITVLGCSMSFIGLSCIWVTAICFQSFRREASNKVLLNISVVLTLLTLFFMAINAPELWTRHIHLRINLDCKVLGIFLHYIIMVLFFWMLVIAIMQYQRYVKVFGYNRPNNYITKYAIAAWGVPWIPVILVAYLDPDTYTPHHTENTSGICYPKGNSLKYGVLLPIALIILCNLSIFIYIFCSLRRALCQFKHRSDRYNMILQLRVSVFLFFLLGISWIFGLLSTLGNSLVFSYLHCLTSTLQGLILFIYSIIIDKPTRTSWMIFCCAKSYRTMEGTNKMKHTNSSSLQTSRYK